MSSTNHAPSRAGVRTNAQHPGTPIRLTPYSCGMFKPLPLLTSLSRHVLVFLTFDFFAGALLCFPRVILRYASTVAVLFERVLLRTPPPSIHLSQYMHDQTKTQSALTPILWRIFQMPGAGKSTLEQSNVQYPPRETEVNVPVANRMFNTEKSGAKTDSTTCTFQHTY